MSLAENLLNILKSGDMTQTNVYVDDEEPIIINESRMIIVPAKLKTIAVIGDKDVETVTVKCIRYWDVIHDLSTFAIFLNYTLPNGESKTYIPHIIGISNDYFTFEWVIGREFTGQNGSLSFSIIAKKVDIDGNLLYQWGSFINSEISIASTIPVGDEAITEEEKDIITQLISKTQINEDVLDLILDDVMPIKSENGTVPYTNVVLYLVSNVVAIVSYVDIYNVERSISLSSNLEIPLKVARGTTLTIVGENISSCDASIAPYEYPNDKKLSFVLPETEYEGINITLDSVAGREYEPFHEVKISYSTLKTYNLVAYVKVNGVTELTLSPDSSGILFEDEYIIRVPDGAKVNFTSVFDSRTYGSASLYRVYSDGSKEFAFDFTDKPLNYTVFSVNEPLSYELIALEEQ